MECAGSERARKGCRVWSALIQSPFTLAYDPLPAQPWLLWQKISSKSYSRCSLPVCVPTGNRGIHPGSGSLASVPAGDVQWQWQLLLSTVLRREWYLCVPSQVHHFQLQGWSILWATNSLVTPHTYLTPNELSFSRAFPAERERLQVSQSPWEQHKQVSSCVHGINSLSWSTEPSPFLVTFCHNLQRMREAFFPASLSCFSTCV